MWRYLLLGIPLLGLVLFFVLSFERALFCYLLAVAIGFFLYYKLQARMEATRATGMEQARGAGAYREE